MKKRAKKEHELDRTASYTHMVFFVDKCTCGKGFITASEEDRKKKWEEHTTKGV